MPEIKFQIMSDLHLETPLARSSYEDFAVTTTPQSPYLALLGDIGYTCDTRLFEFLEEQLRHFKIVFFLLGNHEPYTMSFPAAKALVKTFAARMDGIYGPSNIGRFVFLDQTRFDIDEEITVLGCTLFSRISEEQVNTVKMFVTDFSSIEDWDVDDHNKAHDSDVKWLNAQVKAITENEPARKIVIFTHHSPTLAPAATDPKHKDDSAQVVSGFATDLSNEICWSLAQVKLWAFGHTHFNCDFEDPLTKKRVFANQKGYRRTESLTFDATKTVSIEHSTPPTLNETSETQDQGMQGSKFRHTSRPSKQQNDRRKKCIIM
jgi:Calcineurin-like phosphoesterase